MEDNIFAEINMVHGPLMAARVIEWVYKDASELRDRLIVIRALIENADIDEGRLESMMKGEIIIGLMPLAWWKKEYRKYIHAWWEIDYKHARGGGFGPFQAAVKRRIFFEKLEFKEFKEYAKKSNLMIDMHIIKIQEIFISLTNLCPVDYAIKIIDWINKDRHFRCSLFDIIIPGRTDSGLLVEALDDLIGIDPKGLSDFQKAVLKKVVPDVDWRNYYYDVLENMWEADQNKMEYQIDPCYKHNVPACQCRRSGYHKGVTWDQFFEYVQEKNILLNK